MGVSGAWKVVQAGLRARCQRSGDHIHLQGRQEHVKWPMPASELIRAIVKVFRVKKKRSDFAR